MQLLVEEYPNATFELTHWLVKALNDGDPIVESAMDYIAGNCLKVSTFEQQKAMLNGFGRALIKRGHPSGDQCLKAAEMIEDFRERMEPTVHQYAIPESYDAGLQYIRGLENPKAAAVSALAFEGGLAYSDILRDKHRLGKAHDGLVEVSKREARAARQPEGRTVEFNAEILHEMDPLKEVIDVLTNVIFDSRRGRELQREVFGPFMTGSAYTVDQLRAANAIHRLQRGHSIKDVAEFQGVQVESLKDRLDNYCPANGIDRLY